MQKVRISFLDYLKFACSSLCVASILRIFLRSSPEFHYSMFLNIVLFLKYFGILFFISLLPTVFGYFVVHFSFRKNRFFPHIQFVSFVFVYSLVLEGLELFAANFD